MAPRSERGRLDRRRLLALGASGLGAWTLFGDRARASLTPVASPLTSMGGNHAGAPDGPRTLVLLQLTGGNDGLSTVVPHGDDAYGRARSATRLERGDLLPLDDYRGLHPALSRLRERFERGGLAIVEGVGYPRPNRSHFRSLEIWHAADPRGRELGEGWIGRLLSERWPGEPDPLRAVHVGPEEPYSLRSTRHPALTLATPEAHRWIRGIGGGGRTESPATTSETGSGGGEAGVRGERLGILRAAMAAADDSAAKVRAALEGYRPGPGYPRHPADDGLASALQVGAALIHAEVGCRVLSVELRGFDTHQNQRFRHDRQMQLLDGPLDAFLEDCARSEAGRGATVLVFSEFGRRVAENGSRGTDHGTAGPVLVAGAGVAGGLHGRHPSLDDLDQGDLVHTTDFRSVYATLIEGLFGVDPASVLGASFPRVGFLN